MSSAFFVVLASNTKSYQDNKPNKFRVRLGKKIRLDGNYVVGLHSILYPNTWSAIGHTTSEYMSVKLKDGKQLKFEIPRGSYLTPEQLASNLHSGIIRELEIEKNFFDASRKLEKYREKRNDDFEQEKITNNDDNDEEKRILKRSAPAHDSSTVGNTTLRAPQKAPTPKAPKRAAGIDTVLQETVLPAAIATVIIPKAIDSLIPHIETPNMYPELPSRPPEREYKKGDMFLKHPDLQKRWNEAKVKDFITLGELMKEKHNRDGWDSIKSNNNYIRQSIVKELAGEGSELYTTLMANIGNAKVFYRILNETDYTQLDRLVSMDDLSEEEREIRLKLSIARGVKFDYSSDLGRFMLKFNDDRIDYVELSDQIAYVLGYDINRKLKNLDTAQYSYDLKGGVSHLCCYTDIVEELPFGDSLSPLLQIIAVSGKPG